MQIRNRVTRTVVVSLILSLTGFVPTAIFTSQIATAATAYSSNGLSCTTTGVESITVTASHGQGFYVDGTNATATDDLDANYVGYQVSSTSGTYSNLWVKVDSFTAAVSGKSIVLAQPNDATQQIASDADNLAVNETATAFFLMKATGVNDLKQGATVNQAFSHQVSVYSGNPSSGSATLLRQCLFTFTKIQGVLEASANKVDSTTVSNSAPKLGETVTVTVTGQTGLIGDGASPDNDIIWLSPSPYSDFPTRALQLLTTQFTVASCGSVTNQLLLRNVKPTSCYSASNYTAKYVFKVIGSGPSNQRVTPVANISSGTQVKHTNIAGSTFATIDLSGTLPAAGVLTVSKTETHTLTSAVDSVTIGSSKYWVLYYEESATSTSSTPTSLDFIVDSPTADSIMDTTTATYRYGSGTRTPIVPSQHSDGKYYFDGPFNVVAGTPLIINYKMWAKVRDDRIASASDTRTVYSNAVYGLIGDRQITSANGLVTNTVEITNPTGAAASNGLTFAPGATTENPTSITASSAVLNGSLTGLSGLSSPTAYFQISRTTGGVPTGDSSTVSTVAASDSVTVTGLLPRTTYYYRIVLHVGATYYYGEIVSFTTPGASATTSAATSISKTSAQLNGTITIPDTSTYSVYFDFGKDGAFTIETRTVTVGNESSTVTVYGSVTGLTAGTTYYFEIVGTNDTETVSGGVLSFTTTTDPAPSSGSTKLIPEIIWKDPATILYPTPLGGTQLNAVAKYNGVEVPGTYVYQYPSGTVLQPGTYPMVVTFIPTDGNTYASLTTTVTIKVIDEFKAPTNANTSPITFTQGKITWDPTPGANSYKVEIWGVVVCTTPSTACTVNKTIGPKTPVFVSASNGTLKSAKTRAVYSNDKYLTAIIVNFATNSFAINAVGNAEVKRVTAIIKREGFTQVEITGHTDPRGGALNVPLSNNRSKALQKAMAKLVPGLTFSMAGLSYDDPKAPNTSAKGMATNRRSEGAVK